MAQNLNIDKVFVAHVKSGAEARRESIDRQLSQRGIPYEFMLNGDLEDMPQALIDRWFLPKRIMNPKMMSCTCKHLLIYEQMHRDGLKDALILEDDIFLSADFVVQFNKVVQELFCRKDTSPSLAWISFENSTLRFPPRSVLTPSMNLYRALEPRCTGAYYIGAEAARSLLKIADSEKLSLPIDCFVEVIAKRSPSPLELYWCHPTIAEQGSMNGVFDSIDERRTASLWRKVKWNLDKCYKVLKHGVSRK